MKESRQNLGRRQLFLWSGLVAIVWLVLLPAIAMHPKMHARSMWLEQQRIDPSAMFYTELDAMEPILERLNASSRKTERPTVADPSQ